MPKEFTYRGQTVEQLQQISMDDFINLLPSRQRRALLRVPPNEQRKLREKVRKARKDSSQGKTIVIRTHCRETVILPEMLGLTINVHDGKEFQPVEITAEKLGHRLGEFAITNKKVSHGTPGIGASRSSMYVPLK
ncbi:30S ribosomal protein S19 [Candidatus Bathyarchaeota archaeon]|nr:30S ribosomal protein S19 [Candidatus Bathyarchaeota archaeon]